MKHVSYSTKPAPDGGLLVREKWPGGGRAYHVSKEQVDSWKEAHNLYLSPQEQAYEYVTETFLKLLQQDKRIGAEHKKSVIAFYEDMFAHEGVRNNMIQAFSNFLDEVNKRVDKARQAGMEAVREEVQLQYNPQGLLYPSIDIPYEDLGALIDRMLLVEQNPEEENLTDDTIANMDLSEVGGDDEDDTPLI